MGFERGKIKRIGGLRSGRDEVEVEILEFSRYGDDSYQTVKLGFVANVPAFGYRTYKILRRNPRGYNVPKIKITGVVGGGLSAMNLITGNPPALVIIDSGLSDEELTSLLRQIKAEQPQIRCLVLAETSRQKETVLTLGADAVILRSEPTERLVEALDGIGLW